MHMWTKISLLVTLFIFTYIGAISSLINTWLSRDDYSHGFLIPIISLYFVWAERQELKYLPIQPNILSGLILTLVGSFILLMGDIGGVLIIQQISIIVVIPGLVLLLLGSRFLKALSLPLAYLIFMVPVFGFFIEKIHWPFQLITAAMSAEMLKLLNIPVFRHAQYLELSSISIEVAKACSGVGYLVSIVAIGIPLAYFSQKSLFRRSILVGIAIVIGIVTNWIRVALIGIWAFNGGEIVHGPLHIFQGLFVSVVGFALLFASTLLFRKIPSSDRKTSHIKRRDITDEPVFDSRSFNQAWFTAIFVLFGLGSYLFLYSPEPVSLKKDLRELPWTIGEWRGGDIGANKRLFNVQGADFEITRAYRKAPDHEIMLYVGYFESQKQDKELINYRLENLYDNAIEIEIPIGPNNNARVNKSLFKDGMQDTLVLFWYDLNGKIIADNYKAKLLSMLDALLHRRTNGAIIIVSSNLDHPKEDIMPNDEVEFIQALVPVLRNHLP